MDGQCVWNALLAGVIGLGVLDVKPSHSSVCKRIRTKLPHALGALESVTWNGEALSQQEREEVLLAVEEGRIGDGYDCGAWWHHAG